MARKPSPHTTQTLLLHSIPQAHSAPTPDLTHLSRVRAVGEGHEVAQRVLVHSFSELDAAKHEKILRVIVHGRAVVVVDAVEVVARHLEGGTDDEVVVDEVGVWDHPCGRAGVGRIVHPHPRLAVCGDI